jgi:hypothetical protein
VPRNAGQVTFADLAAIEIDDYLKNDRKSIEDLKIRLNKHLLPVFGHMKARRMRPAEINRYIAERKDAGTANATINANSRSSNGAFKLGIDSELIHSGPRIKMLKENNARTGFFGRDQLDSILRRLPDT